VAGTDVLTEAGRTARAVGVVLWRRLPRILAGLAGVVTVLAVFALAGAVADDVAISSDEASATAEVLDGSGFARTLVRFPTPDGQLRVPQRGVYSPRGLQPGTSVRVEYARADPELVRVAGSTAFSRVLPLLGIIAAGWLVFGTPALALRRRRAQAHQE
jgi:hypothetical protein